MSDTAPNDNMLKRVEQILDALETSNQSSTEFKDGCDQLERYLNDHRASLIAGGTLAEPQKSRVAVIVERLTGLQIRAKTRANIPTELQKYIAEQSD